jgi:hypothetical protein
MVTHGCASEESNNGTNSKTSVFLTSFDEILSWPINLTGDILQKFMVVTCCTLNEVDNQFQMHVPAAH